MVDPHVHFHVLPRYDGERTGADLTAPDAGWPGQPDLAQAVKLDNAQIAAMTGWLKPYFA
jgi:diadenosine tetraphosphate (Ap4A) HIT family hydrolase